MACFPIYQELGEVGYLFLQNKCPNLKTTYHIKLRFFL